MNKIINYKKKVFFLIIIISLFRILISAFLELGNDESYYWVYSQYLQWNYFDHPPMVAIWIRIFTGNLLLQDHPVFIRLGSVIACGISTWFMFKTVSTIGNDRGGWIAAWLYNASFYAGLSAGILILPDSPQMIFWTFSLWMIAKIFLDEDSWLCWIGLGVSTGLCIMCKVHGVYIWIGFILYILLYNRNFLKKPQLFISLLITAFIISPVLIWNIRNDFITYRFHSERIIIHGYLFNLSNFIKEIVQEVLVNNPVNVFLIIIVSFFSMGSDLRKNPVFKIFNLIGISLIMVVLFLSLFRDTRPIWNGPGYITLIPLTAMGIALNETYFISLLRKWTLVIFVIVSFSIYLVIEKIPGTYGKKDPYNLGRNDITLDMYGWNEAGKSFSKIYKDQILKGNIQQGTPLVCNNWWGAHEEYYFCRPLGIEMIGLGPVMNLHQYMWTNSKRQSSVNMNTVFCIIHSDENYKAASEYRLYYNRIDSVATIQILRNGLPAHNFNVLKLSEWKNNFPKQTN